MRYFILLFLFSGCANYQLRKTCENTNWFNYSQGVAFSGRYLEEDALIKDCKKEDIISSSQIDLGFKLGREKMCTYEEMYNRGKSGEPVYFDFCQGLSKMQMFAQYDKGLEIFCTEAVGLNYGKSGSVYKKVCKAQSEPLFMKGYRPGRSLFLQLLIQKNTAEINQLNNEYSELLRRETVANMEYNAVPSGQRCGDRSVYNEESKQNETRHVCVVDDRLTDIRSRITSQLSSIRHDMSKIRQKKASLDIEIKNAEKELLVLKN